MSKHQSWHNSREAAEACVGPESARIGGHLISHAIEPSGERFRLDLEIEPESWAGAGYIAKVDDLPCEDGSDNYEVQTDSGKIAGPFRSASAARAWARKNSVRVRAGVVHRKHAL